MTKHMQRDLERLQALVLKMAGDVEGAVYSAIRALRDHDRDAARKVIDGDTEIDLMENELQEECLKILALHQPVAVDLRRVAAVLLISTDLERMGDLAVGIAERAEMLSAPPYLAVPDRLTHMTTAAANMVRKALDSFVHLDATTARQVVKLDDEVDDDNDHIIDWLTAEMMKRPENVAPGISLFSAVRHLERIADHATNIAEDVIYLVEGEMVRHHPEAFATPPPTA
jgi:phosphate transport system protein